MLMCAQVRVNVTESTAVGYCCVLLLPCVWPSAADANSVYWYQRNCVNCCVWTMCEREPGASRFAAVM